MAAKIKIAFIATNELVPWGGSELCWAEAAETLARSGVVVHVSVKDWGSPVKHIEHLRSVGCHVLYRTGEHAIPPFIHRQFRRLFSSAPYREAHVRSVGNGSDLVVISIGGSYEALEWILAVRSSGLRYVVISQSGNEQWWPHDKVAEKLVPCFEGARAAFFVSQANLDLTRRQLATPLPNGRVIRNPFKVRYDAQPPWPGDPVEDLSLACVGRLDPFQKGQDVLLQVLGQPHWRTRKVQVTLAGNGLCEQSLRKMVATMKLPGVEFAGFVDDVEEFWSRHHAFVLPSRFEGMPLALVEAMLCGRACIVTDVGGNRELVRDSVNGFLAKAPTVELLDEAMSRAWENRHRLREMGEQAARDVRQWVSPDPTGDFVRELKALVEGSDR